MLAVISSIFEVSVSMVLLSFKIVALSEATELLPVLISYCSYVLYLSSFEAVGAQRGSAQRGSVLAVGPL